MKTITYNPGTHVLVPREPTRFMVALGWDSAVEHGADNIDINDTAAIYRAMIAAAPQPEPNRNWCAVCSPDNCSGCGAGLVESEPAMWVMKHIRSGDLAQAKPNQKALHPYMWSDAFPRYTTPQPDRTAELAALELEVVRLREALTAMVAYAREDGCGLKIADEALSAQFTPTALNELIEKVEKMTIERCAVITARSIIDMPTTVEISTVRKYSKAIRALPVGHIKLEDLL